MTFKSGDLLGLFHNATCRFDICRLYISNLVCVQIYIGINSYYLILTNHNSDDTWSRIA